jgi:hypothetical protein
MLFLGCTWAKCKGCKPKSVKGQLMKHNSFRTRFITCGLLEEDGEIMKPKVVFSL